MKTIELGKIVTVVGLKGEVKVYSWAEDPARYTTVPQLLVGGQPMIAESMRTQGASVILKLQGVDDRNHAEKYRGKTICILEDDLPELPKDTFYVRDLIGMMAIDQDTGRPVGPIKDVLQNTPQDVYVIDAVGTDVLVPAVQAFIKAIDPEKRQIRIHFIEGMLP